MENMFSLFNSDIVNLLLNINRGKSKKPNFIILVVWYTLIVGGLVLVGVLVAWSRKSPLGPAEIASFVSLVLFKNAGRDVSPRFHLFVSDVNQGNKTLTIGNFTWSAKGISSKLWYSCSKSKSYSQMPTRYSECNFIR